MCFLNRKGQNSDLTTFTSKIKVFCGPEWTKRGCITASGNILASGNISLKLFTAPLETIELLTFSYVLAESHFVQLHRSSHPEVFYEKGVLKICSKFTGEQPCRSVISIKLQSSFIEIIILHDCSSVNLLHIFRIPFPRSTSGRLLLNYRRFPTFGLE